MDQLPLRIERCMPALSPEMNVPDRWTLPPFWTNAAPGRSVGQNADRLCGRCWGPAFSSQGQGRRKGKANQVEMI
jgi:hypothetical protein